MPIARGWEVVEEAPVRNEDPELAAYGLRESVARHYTRARAGGSEVCTIELWRFATAEHARAAAGPLRQPGWEVREAGPLLVLAHGVRLEIGPGGSATRGLPRGCPQLLDATHDRAL